MSDTMQIIQEGYQRYLLESKSSWSSRDNNRYLKEKEMEVMIVVHALGSVAIFKQIPNPPVSEAQKVVASIRRAMSTDPDFFRSSQMILREYIDDAFAFLNKYE